MAIVLRLKRFSAVYHKYYFRDNFNCFSFASKLLGKAKCSFFFFFFPKKSYLCVANASCAAWVLKRMDGEPHLRSPWQPPAHMTALAQPESCAADGAQSAHQGPVTAPAQAALKGKLALGIPAFTGIILPAFLLLL